MDDLVRGWDIAWAHGHLSAPVLIAILVPLFVTVWFAFWAVRGRRKPEEDLSMRPKPREPLPGPDRGFR